MTLDQRIFILVLCVFVLIMALELGCFSLQHFEKQRSTCLNESRKH